MLEEGDAGGRNGNDLLRRDVDQIDCFFRHLKGIAAETGDDDIVDYFVFLVHPDIRLGDMILFFLIGGQINYFIGYQRILFRSLLYFKIRRLDKTVLVDAGVSRERVNQADVLPFRRFDRTNPPVVGNVNVANLESRPFPV